MCECLGGKPGRAMKVRRWESPCLGERHHRPIMIFGERFESEHTCWDPKDGELCLRRTKSWETKMEVRRDSDVQIDLQI